MKTLLAIVGPTATGKTALYKEVLDRIADTGVDAITNLTTGYGARYIPSDDNPAVGGAGTTLRPPEQRLEHVLALRPEITPSIARMVMARAGALRLPLRWYSLPQCC